MMVIAHAHERCFLLQEELNFRLYEAVLLFAGTQHCAITYIVFCDLHSVSLLLCHVWHVQSSLFSCVHMCVVSFKY